MRYFFLLALALVSVNTQAKQLPETAPQEASRAAAETFYNWVSTSKTAGLPSPQQMQKLKLMLTEPLVDLIEKSRVVEKQCIKNTPKGDKPPIFEGALLVGNYEGADEVELGGPKVQSAQASVSARLFMIDSRYPKAHPYRVHSWMDQVSLRFNGSRWQVADVVFEEKNSLVEELTQYIEDNKSCSNQK